MNPGIRKYLLAAAITAGGFLFLRYLLPLTAPFLLGAGLAFAAEPLVQFFEGRLRLRRTAATGIGITAALVLVLLAVSVLLALLIRVLGNLSGILPELEAMLRSGMDTAERFLQTLSGRAPGEFGALVRKSSESLISGGDGLISRITGFLLKLASGLLSHVPGSALSIGTGIISCYMISGKLPSLRRRLHTHPPFPEFEKLLGMLQRVKAAFFGWLKAQLKLSSVTFLLMAAGFLLLRVPHGPLWALLVALVDAFPILGTGTALVPWSLIAFLQGDSVLAFGLLGLYAAAALTRSVLEPRFLGKQLGLDPLVTLMALYAGFRLWGIGGMILAPVLAVAVSQLLPQLHDAP